MYKEYVQKYVKDSGMKDDFNSDYLLFYLYMTEITKGPQTRAGDDVFGISTVPTTASATQRANNTGTAAPIITNNVLVRNWIGTHYMGGCWSNGMEIYNI